MKHDFSGWNQPNRKRKHWTKAEFWNLANTIWTDEDAKEGYHEWTDDKNNLEDEIDEDDLRSI